jgi:hypothetical protein
MTLQNAPQSDDEEVLLPTTEGQEVPAEGTPEDSADAPLTRAEFDRLWAEREQTLSRQVQSATDRAESRMAKRFSELSAGNARAVAVAKQAGIAPEQIASYEKALHEDAMKQAMSEGSPSTGSGNGLSNDVDPQAVTAEGFKVASNYGLTTDDPEQAFIQTSGTPQQYIQSIHYAGRLKQQRLTSAGSPPSTGSGNGQTKPAQVPGMVRGGKAPPKNPIADINSADDLYEMGWNDMKKRASG